MGTERNNGQILALVLIAAILGPAMASADPTDATTRVVKLTIDYGDGVEKRFTRIAWIDGMTVFSATQAAQKHPRGIRFKYRGKGTTAFLFEIDGLKNEASGRGWLFQVNGKRAERSFATVPLKAGDTVLWEFGSF